MTQTPEGALKCAAKKTNTPIGEYLAKIEVGEKWCYHCREWHPRSAFGPNKVKKDGLDGVCYVGRRSLYKKYFKPIPAELSRQGQKPETPARDGDKKQARARVNHMITRGLLPKPNDLPCVDCGHIWKKGERRHEYDHFNGYGVNAHVDVEAVCTTCHVLRGKERGENPYNPSLYGKNKNNL